MYQKHRDVLDVSSTTPMLTDQPLEPLLADDDFNMNINDDIQHNRRYFCFVGR